MCTIEEYDRLDLDKVHLDYVRAELAIWHNHYLPVGETVLDLGAGCGETVYFYLQHGAKRIIAIESDPDCVKKLQKNFGADSRVMIIHAHVDSFKVDIDGDERGSVVETHNNTEMREVYDLGGGTVLWKNQ